MEEVDRRLDEVHRVCVVFFDAGPHRQDVWIEDDARCRHARLLGKQAVRPLCDPQLVLDRDRLFDDKLGSTMLKEDGTAEFLFSASDVFSLDSIGERTPDIYFVITESGNEVFRSQVFPEVDFDVTDPVTGRQDNVTREFGPFRVTA